jgi:hypothetical protein
VLLEAILNLFSLNIGWFFEVAISNLFWTVGLFIAICFFVPHKPIFGFFILTLNIWAWLDFLTISGGVVFVAGFLMFLYLLRMIVVTTAASTKQFQNKLIFVNEMCFVVLFILYNLGLVGY